MKLPWWLWLALALLALGLLWWAVASLLNGNLLRGVLALLGGGALLVKGTAATAGAVVNESAKALGAREVKQKPGPKQPRHDGLNTHEPHSVSGEKPRPKTPKHDSW